jgi:hypothetical protein
MTYFFHPSVLIFWIAISWLFGMLGRKKRFGFYGNFMISFLFSPVVGALVLLASDDRPPARRQAPSSNQS